jgi:hypothetical protein
MVAGPYGKGLRSILGDLLTFLSDTRHSKRIDDIVS